MDTEACLDREYSEAVRHMSGAQVSHIESGAPCDSPKMQYAQQCYRALCAKQQEIVGQGTLFSSEEM